MVGAFACGDAGNAGDAVPGPDAPGSAGGTTGAPGPIPSGSRAMAATAGAGAAAATQEPERGPAELAPQTGQAERATPAVPDADQASPDDAIAEPGLDTMAEAPEAPAMEGRYPDACPDRRPSRSEPCSDDPDPCGLNSGYPGDEYCLLPPPPGEGIQIHFGPKDYNDPEEVAKYLLQPGEEFNDYAIAHIPTTEEHWYRYVKISMRPGSHHLINRVIEGSPPEGFTRGGCEADSIGGFPGTQNLITESPPQGIPAPENVGFGRRLPAGGSLCQNYHRYNVTEEPALSEIWYNVWFMDQEEITQRSSGVMIMAGPFRGVAPGARESLTRTATVQGEGRILSLFGHRHAATERFAVWLNDDLIYDSWDWVESVVFNYDSITMNPPPAPEMKTDGAVSGPLPIKAGDRVKVQCDINNTTDRTLRFANDLYGGEMCILFGGTVGTSIR